MLELRARWAPNVVTAFATIDGRPVGILANQPLAIAGTLDIPASQKGARFVAFCDAFNLPIITLVDTPGFYPGKDLEWRGMIRHGAQLVFAYGRATVARICVILRKSYGGAYIVMDSKRMGNDICLAWPGAELAVMGAGQAAAILQRRATPEERAAFERDYAARLLNPYIAAERGYVDAVIEPAETRREISRALRHAVLQAGGPAAPQARQQPAVAPRRRPMTTLHVRGACPHDCPDTCAWTATRRGRSRHRRPRRSRPPGHGRPPVRQDAALRGADLPPGPPPRPPRSDRPQGRGGVPGGDVGRSAGAGAGRARRRHRAPRPILGPAVLLHGHDGRAARARPWTGGCSTAWAPPGWTARSASAAGAWAWGLTYPAGWPATDIETVDEAELVVAWGANMVSTHLHFWPYFLQARKRGATIVCIDPVRTKTARAADVHLAPRPGSDGALALGCCT